MNNLLTEKKWEGACKDVSKCEKVNILSTLSCRLSKIGFVQINLSTT